MAKINISIPTPCHENWDAMSAENKGRFCSSCQKKVHDFTNASDREIVTAFQQNQNLCGRFLNSQLNRDLIKPEKKNPVWLATTSAIISLIGFGATETSAQEKPKTEQTPIDRERALGKFMVTEPQSKEIDIEGVVIDESDLPMPGANIIVKGKEGMVNADFDGQFKIKARANDTLVVNYLGYHDKKVIVSESFRNQKIVIKISEDIVKMQGEIVTVGGLVRKRSFFGRIFHRIGNLFR